MAQSRKQQTETFREQLGDRAIEIGDYKVDDLRKIASEFGVSGSHGLKKDQLVEAINKARQGAAK